MGDETTTTTTTTTTTATEEEEEEQEQACGWCVVGRPIASEGGRVEVVGNGTMDVGMASKDGKQTPTRGWKKVNPTRSETYPTMK